MSRTRSVRILLALGVGGALALGPAIAPAGAADTQVGATFGPTGSGCSVGSSGVTVLQTTSPADTYRTPAGVVTSWRTQPGGTDTGAQIAFKVGRGAGSSYSIVGSSDLVAISGTPIQRSARIPVQAGDYLGFFYSGTGNCANTSAPAYSITGFAGNPPVGPAGTAIGPEAGAQLNIAATVEPDADGDGFGDTTQDLCPTKATTQKECVPPTTSVVAKAGKAKRKANGKYKKATVTVAFATSEAATSVCSVDGAAAVACLSPLVFKAKKGTHTVTVVSTDTTGNVGTPVTTAVTVKKAKSKGKKK